MGIKKEHPYPSRTRVVKFFKLNLIAVRGVSKRDTTHNGNGLLPLLCHSHYPQHVGDFFVCFINIYII